MADEATERKIIIQVRTEKKGDAFVAR